MARITPAFATLALAALLAPANTFAQDRFDPQPGLTKAQLETFAGEIGSILRFRQVGDPTTLGKGNVELGARLADTPLDGWTNTRTHTVATRFGVSSRVDIGVSGGVNQTSDYGLIGVDTTVALLSQHQGHPVSLSLRPNATWLLGKSALWAGTSGIDLSVSRAVGPLAPYAGVATTASVALERSAAVNLEPGVATQSLSYAGLAYRWRAFVVAAEVEKAAVVSYALRIGTRF